ncbi:11390_t:CDS:1, partial [Gigaspora margarita]
QKTLIDNGTENNCEFKADENLYKVNHVFESQNYLNGFEEEIHKKLCR